MVLISRQIARLDLTVNGSRRKIGRQGPGLLSKDLLTYVVRTLSLSHAPNYLDRTSTVKG